MGHAGRKKRDLRSHRGCARVSNVCEYGRPRSHGCLQGRMIAEHCRGPGELRRGGHVAPRLWDPSLAMMSSVSSCPPACTKRFVISPVIFSPQKLTFNKNVEALEITQALAMVEGEDKRYLFFQQRASCNYNKALLQKGPIAA